MFQKSSDALVKLEVGSNISESGKEISASKTRKGSAADSKKPDDSKDVPAVKTNESSAADAKKPDVSKDVSAAKTNESSATDSKKPDGNKAVSASETNTSTAINSENTDGSKDVSAAKASKHSSKDKSRMTNGSKAAQQKCRCWDMDLPGHHIGGGKIKMIGATICKCPVAACKPLLNYMVQRSDLVQHWKMYHLPQQRLFCCPKEDCSFASSRAVYKKLHTPYGHGYAVERVLKNALFIHPGEYRLSNFKDVEIPKMIDLSKTDISKKCPVPGCHKVLSNHDFKQHYNKVHVPVHKLFKCNAFECNMQYFEGLGGLDRHLRKGHGLGGLKLISQIRNMKVQNKINLNYIDPCHIICSGLTPEKTVQSEKLHERSKLVSYDTLINRYRTDPASLPIVILIRGLPGAGKTRLAKYMKVYIHHYIYY